jgi:ABC-type transport system involved in Fe-S cluster assembly fused permease/ATPase subunit
MNWFWMLCTRQHAKNLLSRADKGLDTMIGEGGIKLSGGEKAASLNSQSITSQNQNLFDIRRGYLST